MCIDTQHKKQPRGNIKAVLFAIDIDGTIAGASKIFGAYFNQELGLGLPPEEVRKMRWYTSLRKHPAIIEYRREHNERYLEVCAKYREYAPAMFARDPLEGAIEGVSLLAQWGDIRYVTIRISQDQEVNEQIQATTCRWLHEYRFPNPTNVIFCSSFQEKLELVAEQPHEQVVLIDDRCSTDLFSCYEQLAQFPEHQELIERIRQRITFVAFEKFELPADTYKLRMLALPSWKCSAQLLDSLQATSTERTQGRSYGFDTTKDSRC